MALQLGGVVQRDAGAEGRGVPVGGDLVGHGLHVLKADAFVPILTARDVLRHKGVAGLAVDCAPNMDGAGGIPGQAKLSVGPQGGGTSAFLVGRNVGQPIYAARLGGKFDAIFIDNRESEVTAGLGDPRVAETAGIPRLGANRDVGGRALRPNHVQFKAAAAGRKASLKSL